MRISQAGRARTIALLEHSPLRRVDPRTKLFISIAISFVVMLPEEKLLIFIGFYTLLILWAHLLIPTLTQLWRMKWILLILFLLDWWLIGFEHALTICTRLALLTGVFTLFFSTTTTRELGLALEKLRIPYRYAFSLSLAFQSIGIMDDEWRAIREAQVSRGLLKENSTFRRFLAQVSDLVALTVPAIVLTTKRAWSITEAAYARGFDSPKRKSYHTLHYNWLDGVLSVAVVAILIFLYWS